MRHINEELFNECYGKIKKNFMEISKNNLYYRNLFNKYKFNIEDLLNYNDFCKIPIMTKQDYLDNIDYFEKVISNEIYNVLYTSGSTGKPVKIFITKKDDTSRNMILCMYRNRISKNIICEKMLLIHYLNIKGNEEYLIEDKGKQCQHFCYGCINDGVLEEIYKFLKQFQPKWIVGNTSIIYAFSEYIKKSGKSLSGMDIRYIECISEYITTEQRNSIKEVFNLNPKSAYGSNEVNTIAIECVNGNMHVIKESVFVEIVNQNEQGIGDILVTSLDNRLTPFLRYSLGDKGRWVNAECNCNFKSHILEITRYRSNDFLLKKDGTRMEVWNLNSALRESTNKTNFQIKQYQFIQIDYNLFKLKILEKEDGNNMNKAMFESYFIEEFSSIFQEKVIVEFEYVKETIPVESKNGKFKYFKSMLT
ncbi:MAG: hypothetical protein E6323_05870 [Clostridium perfringens]|nr:hypothetical protein [Clostridium perfringens]